MLIALLWLVLEVLSGVHVCRLSIECVVWPAGGVGVGSIGGAVPSGGLCSSICVHFG